MNQKLPVILSSLALLLTVGLLATPATADESGEWACYIGDKFPDVKEAGEWRGAQKFAEGLNATAAHVDRGTIMTVSYPVKMGMGSQVSAPLVCVKN
jgi:hypothetical protein